MGIRTKSPVGKMVAVQQILSEVAHYPENYEILISGRTS